MSTKAEWFRYVNERRKTKSTRVATPPSEGAGAGRPSHSVRKAGFALEVVAPGARPSRKSTRKSANRLRTDAKMRILCRMAEISPEVRAGRLH